MQIWWEINREAIINNKDNNKPNAMLQEISHRIRRQTINKSLPRLLFTGMKNPIVGELTTIGPNFYCFFNDL